MNITVETIVDAPIDEVWRAYSDPEAIKRWNAASDDWHTTASTVDLRPGGTFSSRMEAKDGSAGFDFGGTYTRIVPLQAIEYRMGDGREVQVQFEDGEDGVELTETFDAENTHTAEMQRQGWQAILDNFKRHVEAKSSDAAV